MDTSKYEVCLSSLLYLCCLLVCTTGLLIDQAFTNMGQPMRRWLHWKYHFTWSDPCTISLGVGVVFSLWLVSCIFDSCFMCLFICLLSLLTCLAFSFSSTLYFFVCLLVYVRRLVSHETVRDSWNKQGKVKEDLYNYQYLVIYCHVSVWINCCLQSKIHQCKMHFVWSEPWWKHNACVLTSITYSSRFF